MDYMNLIVICRMFYQTPKENTFFSIAHRAVSGTDHMLGSKTSLNTFKEIKIISFPSTME